MKYPKRKILFLILFVLLTQGQKDMSTENFERSIRVGAYVWFLLGFSKYFLSKKKNTYPRETDDCLEDIFQVVAFGSGVVGAIGIPVFAACFVSDTSKYLKNSDEMSWKFYDVSFVFPTKEFFWGYLFSKINNTIPRQKCLKMNVRNRTFFEKLIFFLKRAFSSRWNDKTRKMIIRIFFKGDTHSIPVDKLRSENFTFVYFSS